VPLFADKLRALRAKSTCKLALCRCEHILDLSDMDLVVSVCCCKLVARQPLVELREVVKTALNTGGSL
jgi:hypothetical protein